VISRFHPASLAFPTGALFTAIRGLPHSLGGGRSRCRLTGLAPSPIRFAASPALGIRVVAST